MAIHDIFRLEIHNISANYSQIKSLKIKEKAIVLWTEEGIFPAQNVPGILPESALLLRPLLSSNFRQTVAGEPDALGRLSLKPPTQSTAAHSLHPTKTHSRSFLS